AVPGLPPWPGQNKPFAALMVLLPVLRGERDTLMLPTCAPSRHPSCPIVLAWQSQGWPPVPLGQFMAAELPPVSQSRVRATELVETQVWPARGPRSQVPVAGLLGLPTTCAPPE